MKKLIAVSTITLTALLGTVSASAEEFTLRVSQHHSSSSALVNTVTKPYAEFIEKQSGGRIKVETFPDGVLHGPRDGFKAILTDITDVAPAYPVYVPNSFHLTHGLYLPGAFSSIYTAIRVAQELYPKYLKGEYQAMGVELAFIGGSAPYDLLTTKKVESLDDLKGMKIRGAGSLVNRMVEGFGATPVTIQAPEMYTAFQQGVIDGVMVPAESILTFRVQEIAKYYVPLSLGRAGLPFAFSRKFYTGLPDDLKKVMVKGLNYGSLLYADFVEEGTKAAMDSMRENGAVFVKLSDADRKKLRNEMQPVYNNFIKKQTDAGYPAKEFIAEMQSLSDKYGDMTREEFIKLSDEHPVKGLLPSM
jgi:TRAP-type transport system periplasmic protein